MPRENFNIMMKEELREKGYMIDPELDEIDLLWDCYDAIFDKYPNAVLSLVTEWETTIAFYFKEHPNVYTEERWAIGISKDVLVEI